MEEIRNFKIAGARRYFRHLDLVREDIREELDLLDVHLKSARICDYGCGNGLTTFGLALESKGSRCIGVDLFDDGTGIDPKIIKSHVDAVRTACRKNPATWGKIRKAICELIEDARIPRFSTGNIVLGKNLPCSIDLAYCIKLLINLSGKEFQGTPTGETALLSSLTNITRCLSPAGILCAVEYDKDFRLGYHIRHSGLKVIKRVLLHRNEIRSRGRTDVQSTMTLYLCSK